MLKNPPANAGDVSLVLDQEDPLEEEMTTYSSVLVWKILRIEEPGRLLFATKGSQRVRHDGACMLTHDKIFLMNLLCFSRQGFPMSPNEARTKSDSSPFL